MHELSIATSLVDVVTEHLIAAGASRVKTVVVEVGDLSGVVPTALRTAFAVAAGQEDGLRGATLSIRPVAVTIACDGCGCERPVVGVSVMRCAVCDRPSMNIVRGRELEVVSIEVE